MPVPVLAIRNDAAAFPLWLGACGNESNDMAGKGWADDQPFLPLSKTPVARCGGRWDLSRQKPARVHALSLSLSSVALVVSTLAPSPSLPLLSHQHLPFAH
jgi:hypothetical protein